MENTFKLGPIQEAWLKRLEEHPERQMGGMLGQKQPDGSYKSCCLGEAKMLLCELSGKEPEWRENRLTDVESTGIFKSYKKLGLYDQWGAIMDGDIDNWTELSKANDMKVPWPKIAAYIRANPENIFTKSV